MVKQLGIYDEFEYAGHWWLPGNEENKISGTLIFNKDGITLELIGSMNGLSSWDEISNLLKNKRPHYSIILGECKKGPVTLINGIQQNTQGGHITTSVLRFNRMIIGTHSNNIEELQINNMQLEFTNLDLWLDYQLFKSSDEDGIKLNYVETFKEYVKSIDATIESTYSIISRYENYKPSLDYTTGIIITTENKRTLD
ncbi:hypothetical protein [Bacillus sp. JJ722]|uniref:ApeA N-terminal domain 1-containing protein n=1 Tax=Bacillus sp. JJ722 TaxID=3122973 RepID=UPI002FFF2095